MAVHVRNLLTSQNPGTLRGWSDWIWVLRELFFAGGWTEVANDGDAAWTNNLLGSGAAAAVAAAASLRITGMTGMTGQEDNCITLLASNDQNAGLYKIRRVISDTEVELYISNAPPDGWLDESGINWRLHDYGYTDQFPLSAFAVMNPPSGTNQAHFSVEAAQLYQMDAKALPLGDWVGAQTLTTNTNFASSHYMRRMRFQAYFSGSEALIYTFDDTTTCHVFHWGELTDVVAADINPGFFSGGYQAIRAYAWGMAVNNLAILRMLDHVSAPIDGYNQFSSRGGQSITIRQGISECTRLPSGLVQDKRPWVAMANTAAGGYIRGRTPLFRYTNENWLHLQRVDPAGTKRVYAFGTVVPMNGPNDFDPFESTTD